MRSILAHLLSDRAAVLAGTLLTAFLLLEAGSLRRMTLTTDESAHYLYGWRILNFDSTRFDNSKMPFSALNAAPRLVAAALRPGSLRRRLESVEFGRSATVVCAVLLGWLIFRWAGELYGPSAGLLALALFVFDPNVLAHGGLVTTDLYAAWMLALAVWSFWRFLNHEGPGTWRVAAASAACFGLAQLAKYSSAYLVPVLALIAAGHAGPGLWAAARARDWRTVGDRTLTAGKYTALFVAAFLVFVNAGYWAQRTFQPLTAYEFRSAQFERVRTQVVRVAPWVRVPVPRSYIAGLDWVLADERSEGNNVYLLGQVGRDGVPGRRFPEYYVVAWLYKEPIATQLLLLLAIVAYVARFRRFSFRRNEWFLAAPVLFFAWYLIFVFQTQMGFRFALVLLPFVFVFIGSLVADAVPTWRGRKLLIGGLVLYLVGSTLSYYPHFIPYFNELVWDRTKAYRILADSNLGWSQNGWYLERYRRRHPDAIIEPTGATSGTVVVTVNQYVGLAYGERFRWLRENFEPMGHVAHGHLIFRVTREDLRRVADPLPADWGDKEE